MFNLQGSEIIVILLIALVVLGPERLPDTVRKAMHTYNELKKMGNGFQAEIKSAFDEPMREMRDTAKMVKDAADPSKFIAGADDEQRLRTDTEIPSPNGATADHQGMADPGDPAIATPDSRPPSPVPPPATTPPAVPPSTPMPPPPPQRPSAAPVARILPPLPPSS